MNYHNFFFRHTLIWKSFRNQFLNGLTWTELMYLDWFTKILTDGQWPKNLLFNFQCYKNIWNPILWSRQWKGWYKYHFPPTINTSQYSILFLTYRSIHSARHVFNEYFYQTGKMKTVEYALLDSWYKFLNDKYTTGFDLSGDLICKLQYLISLPFLHIT